MSETRPYYNPEARKPPSREAEPIEDVTNELFEIHEVTEVFDRIGYPLHPDLQELLGEHNPTERDPKFDRYGSGFTKATYRLAQYARHPRGFRDLKILDHSVVEKIEDTLFHQHEKKRELTVSEKINSNFARKRQDADARHRINPQAEAPNPKNQAIYNAIDRKKIRQAVQSIQSEGSKLIANLIADILCPESLPNTIPALPPAQEDLKMGACTEAELYFLQFADTTNSEPVSRSSYKPQRGEHMNIITDNDGNPLMVEKIGLGENHSCITLKETSLNGVRLPPGSLVGIRYKKEQQVQLDKLNRGNEEQIIPIDAIAGVQFLRLTTLSVSPQERATAFRSHIEQQKNNNFSGYLTSSIEDIRQRAIAIHETKKSPLSITKRFIKKIAA